MNTNKYDWVDFYKEFANILLDYKGERQVLISKVKEVYQKTGINLPTLEKENNIVDIDPFTIFGLFNKSSMKAENRVKIITAIAELFNVTSPVPTMFESIPVLNNQNATFYYFIGARGEKDIDELWTFFELALAYSIDPSKEKRNQLAESFDLAISKKGNANSKITMALYWVAPNSFLNLDKRNIWYIYESGKLPLELVNSLPKIKKKISSDNYFKIVENLRVFLNSEESDFKDFKDLSAEALRYSQEVNEAKKADKKNNESEVAEKQNDTDVLETVEIEEPENTYPSYGPEKFLEEVFMSEDEYKTIVDLLKIKKNVILQGAPGVGKTYAAKRLAYSMMGVKDQNRVMMVQFHQSYSYEDLIEGYRPTDTGFEVKKGALYNFCKKAAADLENDYFFIIDEINRGNLSKIFGELFMLIENDKRGKTLQLLYSDEKFFVPKNVYILGMMNTADRSLAMLDYALRRRFAFYEMKPGFNTEGFIAYKESKQNTKLDKLIDCVEKLNEAIAADDSLGDGFCIGHSYFCNINKANERVVSNIVEYELIPLLKEYWFDESDKVRDWSNNLRGAIK